MKMENKFLCLLFGICSFHPPVQSAKPTFNIVHQWRQLEFDYPSSIEREHDVANGALIPGKSVPIDVDVHYSRDSRHNRIFVTIPRFQDGSPITLGTVSKKQRNGNTILSPYPSWSWHRDPQLCKSQRMVSVFRIKVDRCERLWVLDTGKFGDTPTCSPQILAFDLKTDKLIYKHEIPKNLINDITLLVTPVVDVRDTCDDVFIYAADCQTHSIFVHDVRAQRSWKHQDQTMYPDPAYGTYDISGDSFQLMDGVLGMALEPYVAGRDRRLFYHAMSSGTEQHVFTSALRNQTTVPAVFKQYPGSRLTQAAAEDISRNGIMFFGLMSDVKIACFNIRDDYNRESIDIVADDPVTLQFASGVKIINNKQNIEELWILTSRFQKAMNDNYDFSDTNFRIMAAKVDDLIHGTRCKKHKGNNEINTGGGYGLVHPHL